MNQHLIGVVCGIVGLFAFGIANALSKKVSQQIGEKSTLIYREVLLTPFLWLLFIASGEPFVKDGTMILLCLLLGIGAYLALLSYYYGIRYGQVGVISAIANSDAVIAIILGVIFIGEQVTGLDWFAIALITIGVFLLSIRIDKNLSFSFAEYGLITMVLWGIIFFIYVYPVNTLGPLLAVALIDTGVLIYAVVHTFLKDKKMSHPKKIWWYVIGMGLLPALGLIAYSYGIKYASFTLVVAIIAANPLVMTWMAHHLYNEKLRPQQYLAILLTIGGVILMSV